MMFLPSLSEYNEPHMDFASTALDLVEIRGCSCLAMPSCLTSQYRKVLYLIWRNLKHLQRNTAYPPLHAARNVSQREGFHTRYVGRIVQADVDIFREEFRRAPAPSS